MEVESEFLSHHRTRPQIQIVLEDILVSLNSKQRDCHLLLDDANLLNLHLFRPPPPPTPPVPDHAVPILLRPEWQLQMFDWDLTINWIVPHIDGCKYVKQISVSSEVDMEMVRACLRVLRHHGVLAHVDVFRYSNVYECTHLAMGLLTAGRKTEEAKKLLDAAFWYCAKAKYVRGAQVACRERTSSNGLNSPNLKSNSPSNNAVRRHHLHMSPLHSLDLSIHSSATPLAAAIVSETSRRRNISEETASPRSFPSRTGHMTIREDHSMDENELPSTANKGALSQSEEMDTMKKALAKLYVSCSRSQSFGEMLLAKIENKSDKSPPVEHLHERAVAPNFSDSTLTPLREASESETVASSDVHNIQQQHGANGDGAVHNMAEDWKMVFDYFDHRRLITFGVVHGLIRRVHQYPLANVVGSGNASSSRRESTASHGADGDDEDDFSNINLSLEDYYTTIEMTAIAEEATAAAVKSAMDEMSKATSYSASPLLQSMAPPPLSSRDEMILNKLTQKELHRRTRKLHLERIASAMDGTRCDDELSCMFEESVENLIEMIKDSGRWDIISVYSCAN